LVRVLEPLVSGNRTADRHHRILLSGGGDESRRQVAGARPRRHQNNARRTRQPADRCCHECGVLFMAAHDEFRGPVEQRIEDGIDLGAGDSEQVPDAGEVERLHNSLGGANRRRVHQSSPASGPG